jgi:hypothetical protein
LLNYIRDGSDSNFTSLNQSDDIEAGPEDKPRTNRIHSVDSNRIAQELFDSVLNSDFDAAVEGIAEFD